MLKWFINSMKNWENKQADKVVTAVEKYKETPVDKKFKRQMRLQDIFIAIKTAKGYGVAVADYVGGFYNMEEPKLKMSMTIVGDDLIFDYEEGRIIPLSSIKSVELRSREQINHRVTLTRMLTLGVYSMAVPKKQINIQQYLVINFEDELGTQELLLAGENLGNLHAVLYKKINE